MNTIVPIPRCPVTVRSATIDDLPFIDSLQKGHTQMVGWMPTQQLEGKIRMGHVLVAEEREVRHEGTDARRHEGEEAAGHQSGSYSVPSCLGASVPAPLGYCIGHDQYFKRDDVGIIYQMNVVPDRRRGLIGATLVKAMFDHAAYGCKLFCCWCAQDIEANFFWESLGFVPLAFRAGSRGKLRVHVFWQRRIRAGDTTTPYWFPSQTTSGSIREDRLVFPIPPGTHWSDAKPIILPRALIDEPKQLPTPRQKSPKSAAALRSSASIVSGGLRFVMPKAREPKRGREPRKKVKNDPKVVAAARELRDRWLERVNGGAYLPDVRGKYDIGLQIEARPTMSDVQPTLLLPRGSLRSVA